MTMRDFANHILAVAYENNLSINNLQLQKEMYDEPFYVWRYGPTVPSIYKKYSGYGSRAIIEKGERNNNYSIFDTSIITLLNEKLFSLILESCEHGYWRLHNDKIIRGKSDIKYRLEDALND